MQLSRRQLGTVLAALRLWQTKDIDDIDHMIRDIATDEGEIKPLTNEEIDRLCERFNCGDLANRSTKKHDGATSS